MTEEAVDADRLNYRASELDDITGMPGFYTGGYSIQVASGYGRTKWLAITHEEFNKIKEVLTLGNVGSAGT